MLSVLVAAAVASWALALPAAARDRPTCGFGSCFREGDGLGLLTMVTSQLSVRNAGARGSSSGKGRAPRVQNAVTPGCSANEPDDANAYDMACTYMVSFCRDTGVGTGWLVWQWQRPLDARGRPAGRWQRSGFTCVSPQAAADQVRRPGITQAMIRTAFARLPFAVPRVGVQPAGNVTLVNLPTYYAVRWSRAGLRPGQTTTVTLLGRSVQVRPSVRRYTYVFGDGEQSGPTSSAGGTYPEGDVTHTYQRTGRVPLHIVATYTGQYRLGSSGWQDIALTVPVTGPAQPLLVKQARSVLTAGVR